MSIFRDAVPQELSGLVFLPGDDGYDEHRSVWNATIDRRPAIIIRCLSVKDVELVVQFAQNIGRQVCVKGGGHNIAGSAVRDDAVMIDMSLMQRVDVDPTKRTARVEGGATLADIDAATQKHHLVAPFGIISGTGVAGLTLGGGFGWCSRRYGLAIDNLQSVNIVTACGRSMSASADHNSDLFWAIRGGGGGFGVVTDFTFSLNPVGPEIMFGPTVFPLEQAEQVLRKYRDYAVIAPREVCVWADLMTAPPAPFLPAEAHGKKVVTLMQSYIGDPDIGKRILAPVQQFGVPLGSAVHKRPYVEAQQFLDGAYGPKFCNYWKSANYQTLSDSLISALVAIAQELPTPQSDILISMLGGAIDDVDPTTTAYPHRGAAFAVTAGVRWGSQTNESDYVAWLKDGFKALPRDNTSGSYVNFIGEIDGDPRRAFGENQTRLLELKAEFDSKNLFFSNV